MRTRAGAGFTLIELLVVVAIVAILAAIAIPQFAYQEKAFDARTVSDLKNASIGQETYFSDNLTYSSNCLTLPGFNLSAGVVFSACNGTATSYVMTARHAQGTRTCTWDSTATPPLSCI